MLNFLGRLLTPAAIAFAFSLGAIGFSTAQFILTNPTVIGHLNAVQTAVPTTTTCTLTAGSTDLQGECATTSTSATVTFAAAYQVAPSCVVVDRTSGGAFTQLTYSTRSEEHTSELQS